MSGKLVAHEHLWDRSPFSVRQGSGGSAESRSRRTREQFTQVRAARMRKTLLLPWFVIEFLAREQEDLQCLRLATPSVGVIESSEPPLRCAWASFYRSKGSPTGGNVVEGKNVKMVVVVTVYVQCFVPNPDGGGQGH